MGNKVLLGTRQEWRNWKFRKIIYLGKFWDLKKEEEEEKKFNTRAFATRAKKVSNRSWSGQQLASKA